MKKCARQEMSPPRAIILLYSAIVPWMGWHRRADHPSARSRFHSRFLLTRWGGLTSPPTRGCSSTAEHLASNQRTAVRFRPAAPPNGFLISRSAPFDFRYASGVKGAARCFTVSPVQFRLPHAGVAQLVEQRSVKWRKARVTCVRRVSPVRVRPPAPSPLILCPRLYDSTGTAIER